MRIHSLDDSKKSDSMGLGRNHRLIKFKPKVELMRQKIICAEGVTAEQAEAALNTRLIELGPNFETLSVQGVGLDPKGGMRILLVALVQLTEENNIGDWSFAQLGLTRSQQAELKKYLVSDVSVDGLIRTCGIKEALRRNDNPLLQVVTAALAKHGLSLTEK